MDFQTNQPDVYPGMDSQVDTAGDFRKIADETINRNKLDAARQRAGRGEKHLRRAPDGAWLIIGDGPVHPVVDANGIVYRGDNKEAAIDLARKQATSSL